jgi:hypothetical protein
MEIAVFNHIIGLPQKGGVARPLYDYEKILFDSLVTKDSNKHLWIKKATGLGIEFMLRFMAWLCLKDNALSGSQMCIVNLSCHIQSWIICYSFFA